MEETDGESVDVLKLVEAGVAAVAVAIKNSCKFALFSHPRPLCHIYIFSRSDISRSKYDTSRMRKK